MSKWLLISSILLLIDWSFSRLNRTYLAFTPCKFFESLVNWFWSFENSSLFTNTSGIELYWVCERMFGVTMMRSAALTTATTSSRTRLISLLVPAALLLYILLYWKSTVGRSSGSEALGTEHWINTIPKRGHLSKPTSRAELKLYFGTRLKTAY